MGRLIRWGILPHSPLLQENSPSSLNLAASVSFLPKHSLRAALTLARTWGMPSPQPVFLGCTLHFFLRKTSDFFCIAYFLTKLHKVCNWQVSMTYRCRAITLFSRSYHGPFDVNAHFCGSFQLFFDIHHKSSYP